MIDILMENLQAVLMVAAAIGGGIYALTGFTRETDDEGLTRFAYTEGRWKKNMAVTACSVALMASIAIVPKGYAGVIYDLNGGIVQAELNEGLNFVVPFKQHVTNVKTQVQAWVHNNENVFVHTADFHEIRVPFAINYRVQKDEAARMLQTVSGDPAETILQHAALQSLRTEIGRVKLDNLASEVTDIAIAIQETITPQAEAYGLEVVYVAVEDAIVNKDFIAAVNAERISEREIITAENRVEIAENDAAARVEAAKGEALAIAEIAAAREEEQTRLGLSPTEYVWFTRWDGILPSTFMGDAAEFIVDLP